MTTLEHDANGVPLPAMEQDAEGFVLGAALSSPQGLEQARRLSIQDFTPGRYRDVFTAIVALAGQGAPVTVDTVRAELDRHSVPGGHGLFLVELYQRGVPDAAVWVDRVERAAIQRRLLQLHQEYGQLIGVDTDDRDERLEGVVAEMTAVLSGQTRPDRARRTYDLEVAAEFRKMRVRDEARRALAAEQTGVVGLPEILTLRERLSRPRPPKRWRISDWQPAGSRVMLAAQFKAGKTTIVGNLARCLVDGDLWLGKHELSPVDGTVVMLDFEMSADQIDDWLRDQRIRNDDRLIVIPLRGKASAFNILDATHRDHWAARLSTARAGYVIVDCLRPILDALGLDEHRDAGQFLVALDALLDTAGIQDAVVVHHMGHNGERSRGDSRIRDWPDVEWRLVRQDDEPASPRFIAAYGRDVDIPETQLAYDPTTRHLTLAGGSRKDAAARAALPDILSTLDTADEPLSGRNIEEALRGSEHTQKAIREGVKLGVRLGVIITQRGLKNATLHSRPISASTRQSASQVRQRGVSECVSASIDDALTLAVAEPPSASLDEHDDSKGAA